MQMRADVCSRFALHECRQILVSEYKRYRKNIQATGSYEFVLDLQSERSDRLCDPSGSRALSRPSSNVSLKSAVPRWELLACWLSVSGIIISGTTALLLGSGPNFCCGWPPNSWRLPFALLCGLLNMLLLALVLSWCTKDISGTAGRPTGISHWWNAISDQSGKTYNYGFVCSSSWECISTTLASFSSH